MCNIGLAVILAALIGAAAGGAAAIWFTNRDWRRRLAEFEECQTFLNESRAYTLYKMPTREDKPRPTAPRPADPKPEATACGTSTDEESHDRNRPLGALADI